MKLFPCGILFRFISACMRIISSRSDLRGAAAYSLSKTPGELERAAALSIYIVPGGVYGGCGRILRREIPFTIAKILSLRFSRP